MANPNKRKGTAWETCIREFFADNAILARRTGSAEVGSGDLHIGRDYDWTVEAKNEARIELAGYLAQLRKEIERTGRTPFKSVVFIKRRLKGPGDSYALMGGQEFRDLVAYVQWLERQVDLLAASKPLAA